MSPSRVTINSQISAQRPSPTWWSLWTPPPPSTMTEEQNDSPQRRDREDQNIMPKNCSDISMTANQNPVTYLHSPSARWWMPSPQSVGPRSTISSGMQSLMPSSSSLGKDDSYNTVLYEIQEWINARRGPGNDINLQNINQDRDSNKRIEPHFPVMNSPIFDDLTEILQNVSSVLTQRNHRGSLGLVRMPKHKNRLSGGEPLCVPFTFP
jgi:hypothetical protein